MIPLSLIAPEPAGVLSTKAGKEESGVDRIVTLKLNFLCRSVNVAVGVGIGELAGVVLVTHPDKSNVTTNRETAITIRLAIKDAMAFHAETVRAAQRLASAAHSGRVRHEVAAARLAPTQSPTVKTDAQLSQLGGLPSQRSGGGRLQSALAHTSFPHRCIVTKDYTSYKPLSANSAHSHLYSHYNGLTMRYNSSS
jgi:hypothetical protein